MAGQKKYKKRNYRGNNWASVASKALQGVKFLKGIINSEKKFSDTTNTTTFDYNGGVFALSAVAQGDGDTQRNGNSILLKSIDCRYTIGMNSSAAHTACRVIIFQDQMSLGTIPSPSDILGNTGSALGVCSQLTLTNAKQHRFKILWDKIHTMSNTGSTQVIAKHYFKFHNHIHFTGANGTDEGRNMIYMLVICDLVTSNLPTLNLVNRIGFYDN